MRRCGGDGRRTQAHEVVKLAIKRLALCNHDPGGIAIPPNQLILEARHLRNYASRPTPGRPLCNRMRFPCERCSNGCCNLLVYFKILLIKLFLKLGFCSTDHQKQEVLERPAEPGNPTTLCYATLHSISLKSMRAPRSSLRGHPPGTRLLDDQASIRLPPAPRSFCSTSYGGSGKGPLRLRGTIDLDSPAPICSPNYPISGDAQGCCCIHILIVAYSSWTDRTGPRTGWYLAGDQPNGHGVWQPWI